MIIRYKLGPPILAKAELTTEEFQGIHPEVKAQNSYQVKHLNELSTKENNQGEPFKVVFSSCKFRF